MFRFQRQEIVSQIDSDYCISQPSGGGGRERGRDFAAARSELIWHQARMFIPSVGVSSAAWRCCYVGGGLGDLAAAFDCVLAIRGPPRLSRRCIPAEEIKYHLPTRAQVRAGGSIQFIRVNRPMTVYVGPKS